MRLFAAATKLFFLTFLWWLISSPHLPFIVLLSCPTFPLPSPSFLSLHLLSLPLLMSSSSFTFPSLLPPCSIRDKFVEVDLKPVCKHCYERLPDDMKRRLAKRERDSKEKKKKLIPMCLWSLFLLSPYFSWFFLWSVFVFLAICFSFFLLSMPLLTLRSLIHWVQLASKAWNKNTSREL